MKIPALTIAIAENIPLLITLQQHLHHQEPSLMPTWIYLSESTVIPPMMPDTVDILNPIGSYGQFITNLLAHVTTDYLLWIDTGWSFMPIETSFCSASLSVLSTYSQVSQVKLDSEDYQRFDDRSQFSQPPIILGDGTQFYILSPRKILGGLTLKPAITRVADLRSCDPLRHDHTSDRETVTAALSIRSAQSERYLSMRSPTFTPFIPKDQQTYRPIPLHVDSP